MAMHIVSHTLEPGIGQLKPNKKGQCDLKPRLWQCCGVTKALEGYIDTYQSAPWTWVFKQMKQVQCYCMLLSIVS